MWGCFQYYVHLFLQDIVFPTYVGVFLRAWGTIRKHAGLPHVCGGVSTCSPMLLSTKASSPRMWGCFYEAFKTIAIEEVFPTYVGVFLDQGTSGSKRAGLPHVCGGVSKAIKAHQAKIESSPRMWGCFCDMK